MHNAAIAALGLRFIYIPFPVRPDDVGPAIQSLGRLGIVGVNLTIPHKEKVLPFLDEVDPEARAVGAVNTVQVSDGRLLGFNTDGYGFLAPLAARGFQAAGARAVVLGAGGAARSVVYHLARQSATVTVANRTLERAERLVEEIGRAVPEGLLQARRFDESLAPEIAGAALLVNTTSVGMHPDESPPISFSALHGGQIVYDLIYRPVKTRLLREAERRGADTLNGVGMLVHQGAAAFKIWTGIDPPVDVMTNAVLEGLST